MKTVSFCWMIVPVAVVLTLVSTQHVVATSQTTLEVRIVAPECTIDTVDDGSGPIQIITCPPGVIDPTPLPDNDRKDTTTDNEIEVQLTTNPQISQRLQASVQPRALVNSLRDSGIAIEPPNRRAKVPVTKEVATPEPQTTRSAPTSTQSLLVASASVAAIAVVSSKGAHLTRAVKGIIKKK